MFRLLLLLGVAMFLTMQIGGRDYGQQRFGLKLAAEQAASTAAPAADPAPAVVEEVVASPAPESPAPEPVVVAETAAPEVAPEPAAELAAVPAVEIPASDLPVVYVIANAINVREGPSTNFGIVGRLTKGEAVSVVSSDADGWLRIRLEGDGLEGFVAARLMTEIQPN